MKGNSTPIILEEGTKPFALSNPKIWRHALSQGSRWKTQNSIEYTKYTRYTRYSTHVDASNLLNARSKVTPSDIMTARIPSRMDLGAQVVTQCNKSSQEVHSSDYHLWIATALLPWTTLTFSIAFCRRHLPIAQYVHNSLLIIRSQYRPEFLTSGKWTTSLCWWPALSSKPLNILMSTAISQTRIRAVHSVHDLCLLCGGDLISPYFLTTI